MVLFGLLVAHKKVNKYKTPSRPPLTTACTAVDTGTVTDTPDEFIIVNDWTLIAACATVSVMAGSTPFTTEIVVDVIAVSVSPAARSGDEFIVITRVSSGFL